jgi:hypothetical protein
VLASFAFVKTLVFNKKADSALWQLEKITRTQNIFISLFFITSFFLITLFSADVVAPH